MGLDAQKKVLVLLGMSSKLPSSSLAEYVAEVNLNCPLWLHGITAIISACRAADRGSTPRGVATEIISFGIVLATFLKPVKRKRSCRNHV